MTTAPTPAPKAGAPSVPPQSSENSAPPSGFLNEEAPNKTSDRKSAEGRISTLYGKLKGAERRASEAEAKLAHLEAQANGGGRAPSQDLDLEIEVGKLRENFVAAVTEDPNRAFDTLVKLTDIQADRKLRAAKEAEQAESLEQDWHATHERANAEVAKRFNITPENPQEELLGQAAQIYASDPWLQRSPRGKLDAVLQAANELPTQGARQAAQVEQKRAAQLSAPSHRQVAAGTADKAQAFADAFNPRNLANRDEAMAAYMQQHSGWTKARRP